MAVTMQQVAAGHGRARQWTAGDGGDAGARGRRPAGAWSVQRTSAEGFGGLAALAAWARRPAFGGI